VTLRARLTLTLVALVVIGLVVSDIATYTALRSFLVRRVDQQLSSASFPVAHLLLSPDFSSGEVRADPEGSAFLPAGTWAALYDASGTEVRHVTLTYGGADLTPPAITPQIAGSDDTTATPFTVAAQDGSGAGYRAIAVRLNDGSVVVVAVPLRDVAETLRRLTIVAGLVTLGVLAAMGMLSWVTVRRELRPLRRIEETAGAIAAGDLSRRVEQTDPGTEVGRLGTALNVMLGRIEHSMEEQRASEEALRRFLADASHELRTPLTSIRGYAELFRRGAEDNPGDTAVAMRRIEQESERMGSLVDDLLFLARSGQGRPIAQDAVDLARVAADAVQDARAVDPGREITLDAPDGLVVVGDEDRLHQVVANLLSNALAHTPPGTPVAVRVRATDGGAELEVSDHGLGLNGEQAAHVFEPFFRADPSRGRVRSPEANGNGRGTGLGLSIVAAIAEAHGGGATVTSAPGEGATFTIRLPLEPEAQGSPEDPDRAPD
jgi:two-component system OmpR family sensor kinase